jgi:hypothetical protein
VRASGTAVVRRRARDFGAYAACGPVDAGPAHDPKAPVALVPAVSRRK